LTPLLIPTDEAQELVDKANKEGRSKSKYFWVEKTVGDLFDLVSKDLGYSAALRLVYKPLLRFVRWQDEARYYRKLGKSYPWIVSFLRIKRHDIQPCYSMVVRCCDESQAEKQRAYDRDYRRRRKKQQSV